MRDGYRPVGVCAVVRRRGRDGVLVGKRGPAASQDHGIYGMPGGKVQASESIEDSVRRELFEETGIAALSVRLTAIIDCQDGWVVFAADVEVSADAEPRVMEPGVMDDWEWADDERIREIPLQEGMAALFGLGGHAHAIYTIERSEM